MLSEITYKSYPVLYVDDEEHALKAFARQYSRDFTIYTTRDVDQALKMLESEPIAVVIADQRMPVLSGTRLLSRIHEKHPDTVRILMVTRADIELKIHALRSQDLYRILSKPAVHSEIDWTLRQAIEYYFLVQERERLYAEKVETMRKIARANRLSTMGILSAGMAHEINNPLVSISTFLQMLPQKYDEPEKDQEYWEMLYQVALREVERIRLLVQQLLRYSGTGDPLRFEPLDINPLLHEMILLTENEARKRGVRVVREFGENLPSAWMDKNRIKQVFLNILLNATQATDRGGMVQVHSRCVPGPAGGHLLEVAVSDTGTGISEENLEKLFTPFFTTKESQGSGLGLMTCHRIVDEHRGAIDVQSKLGEGTTFTIRLPIQPKAHERRKTTRRPLSPSGP